MSNSDNHENQEHCLSVGT